MALHESARVASIHEATLSPLWDMDGMVFSEQPVQIGHDFDVVVLEMRIFGMPLVSPLTRSRTKVTCLFIPDTFGG